MTTRLVDCCVEVPAAILPSWNRNRKARKGYVCAQMAIANHIGEASRLLGRIRKSALTFKPIQCSRKVAAMVENSKKLVTGRTSHEIYVVDNGKKRWVPDLWTMRDAGLSPGELSVIEDGELESYEEGEPLPSTVPHPPIREGAYVESENMVYLMTGEGLQPIKNPRLLLSKSDFDPSRVISIPESVIRGLVKE